MEISSSLFYRDFLKDFLTCTHYSKDNTYGKNDIFTIKITYYHNIMSQNHSYFSYSIFIKMSNSF